MNDTKTLRPLLVVRGAAHALVFYQHALGARLLACYEHGPSRRISHADLALGEARFSVTEELREWNSEAPPSSGGTPVILQLGVADAAAAARAMAVAGASLVVPLQRFAGELMARVRDPFGHLWVLRQTLEVLSPAQVQRRRDELFAELSVSEPSASLLACAPPACASTASAAAKYITLAASPAPKDVPTLTFGPTDVQVQKGGQATTLAGVILIVGPVGAGKSTFAERLVRERSALHFALDDWMSTLFSPDRPATGLVGWYRERAERCIEQIWRLTLRLTGRGIDVVLELGLLSREERERFYARVDAAGLPLTVHVLDAAREVRRARVSARNVERGATFSMVVPSEIFELASDLWEPPGEDECETREVRFLRTD